MARNIYDNMSQQTEEAAKAAMMKIDGREFKKRVLVTEYTKVSEEAFRARFETKKKKESEQEEKEDLRTPAEMLADQVTPLYK